MTDMSTTRRTPNDATDPENREPRRPMSPVLKWCGGKTKLLPELVKRIPPSVAAGIQSGEGRYFEPFAGGAALFFHLRPEWPVLGDMNADLIGLYRCIANDVDTVIAELRLLKRKHARGEGYYYKLRDDYNADRDRRQWTPAKRAAAFLYLNKAGFNGLHRVNRSGDFNVPKGRYTNPKILDIETLKAAAIALKDAELRIGEYDGTTAVVTSGDAVYFDPPYDPISETSSFTGYASGGFGRSQQEMLASHARDLVRCGAFVMLSNSDTRFIRSLYRDPVWKIDRVKCPRAINSNAERRGEVNEVIITGGTDVPRRRRR